MFGKSLLAISSLAAGAVMGGGYATFVTLQPTVGSAETGNINITGQVKSGVVTTNKLNLGTTLSTYGAAIKQSGLGGLYAESDLHGLRASTTATAGGYAGGSFSSNGAGAYGIRVINNATEGTAVGGLIESKATGGVALQAKGAGVAIEATTTSPGFGLATIKSTTNLGFAMYGEATGDSGSGVYGLTHSSSFGAGVVAFNDSTFPTSAYGTYTEVLTAGATALYARNQTTGGTAIYAAGNTTATGTKSFLIDHPEDPENKMLRHYCAEGDQPMLNYSGIVKLDSNGNATVSLKSYFNDICKDPRYTLTAIGASMPGLFVSQEVTNNQFKISGGKAGAKVSWEISAVRNDRHVKAEGISDVIDKGPNAGKYLAPNLYNKGEDKAFYARPASVATATQSNSQSIPPRKK